MQEQPWTSRMLGGRTSLPGWGPRRSTALARRATTSDRIWRTWSRRYGAGRRRWKAARGWPRPSRVCPGTPRRPRARLSRHKRLQSLRPRTRQGACLCVHIFERCLCVHILCVHIFDRVFLRFLAPAASAAPTPRRLTRTLERRESPLRPLMRTAASVGRLELAAREASCPPIPPTTTTKACALAGTTATAPLTARAWTPPRTNRTCCIR